MPELPEAETIVRGLRRRVVGETVRRIEVPREDVLRQPRRAFADGIRGRAFSRVSRRGKNVILHLDDGAGVVAVNLGMTGRLLPFPRPPARGRRPAHPAVVWRFASGALLVFDDTRRFGTVEHLSSSAWAARSQSMGPEPLARSFTARRLGRALEGSRSPIRSWLLDQKRIAGVGNIYANEALFRAEIHPRRPASSLREDEVQRLHTGLRAVLREAIRAAGTTLRDYRTAEGGAGAFGDRLSVYGRAGLPCPRCGATVLREVFSARSAFFCPRCQPAA